MHIQSGWTQLLEWSNDWLAYDLADAIARREQYLRRARLQNIAFISDMLEQTKRERSLLVEKYANPYRRMLAMESTVSTTHDIRKLLRLAQNGGNSHIARRKRYEALAHFDQACLLAVIDTSDSYYRLSEDFEEFLETLTTRFFAPRDRTVDVKLAFSPPDPQDPSQDCRVVSVAIADPEDADFRVEGVPQCLPGRHLLTRTEPLPCRTLPNGGILYFDARIKNQYETYLKILWRRSRHKDDPFSVPDRSGVRFIVPRVEDAYAIAGRFTDFINGENGTVDPLTGNFDTDTRADPTNRESSPDFKTLKVYVDWKGRKYEVQIMTFKDYFDSEYVLGDVNHDLYKLRRCLNQHFPTLFPKEIYGVDWADERVRRMLYEEKRRQLRARIDSH